MDRLEVERNPEMWLRASIIALLMTFVFLGGCRNVAPTTMALRSELEEGAFLAMRQAETQNPIVSEFLKESVAVAVFPTVGKGGFVFAGGYGRGVLIEKSKPKEGEEDEWA